MIDLIACVYLLQQWLDATHFTADDPKAQQMVRCQPWLSACCLSASPHWRALSASVTAATVAQVYHYEVKLKIARERKAKGTAEDEEVSDARRAAKGYVGVTRALTLPLLRCVGG